MKRHLSSTLVLIVFVSFSSSCASVYEKQRKEYDTLASSVSAASYAVIGEYGDTIPLDFNADQFLKVIENKIPREYLEQLEKHPLDLKPKGNYYLLLVIDPDSKSIILFDYSCTPEPDGLILLEPNKYDLNNIDSYDPCKTLHNFENGVAIYVLPQSATFVLLFLCRSNM